MPHCRKEPNWSDQLMVVRRVIKPKNCKLKVDRTEPGSNDCVQPCRTVLTFSLAFPLFSRQPILRLRGGSLAACRADHVYCALISQINRRRANVHLIRRRRMRRMRRSRKEVIISSAASAVRAFGAELRESASKIRSPWLSDILCLGGYFVAWKCSRSRGRLHCCAAERTSKRGWGSCAIAIAAASAAVDVNNKREWRFSRPPN